MDMRFLALAPLLALASPALAAPCDAPTTEASLDAAVAEAEVAYEDLDVEGFRAAHDRAMRALPCVDRPLRPTLVARLHRLRGLQLYIAGSEEASAAAFAAARSADPGLGLGDLVPEGHALERVFGQASPGPTERVPEPADRALFLDGVQSRDRPVARPVIVQLVPQGQAPELTRWLDPGAPLPDYPHAVVDNGAPDVPEPPPERTGRGRRRVGSVLLIAGAAAGGGAGLLYGAAAVSRADFQADHPDWTRTDLAKARDRTNNLALASGATGAAAVLLAGTGLVLQW